MLRAQYAAGVNMLLNTLLVLLLATTPSAADRAAARARSLEALNRQMWMPFIEGVRTDRPELYVGIHSRQFYWVGSGSHGRIMDYAEYDDDSRMVMKRRKEAGERGEFDIRFLERNVHGDFASEKCVTKFVLHTPGKPPRTSYSISHYFSRKEDGVWKMYLQHRSPEPATEATFLAAAPIDDYTRFLAAP